METRLSKSYSCELKEQAEKRELYEFSRDTLYFMVYINENQLALLRKIKRQQPI